MLSFPLISTGLAAALALMSIGGGLYEFSVVDPAWPERRDLIQPDLGGLSRRRFWIPAHTAFEIALIVALIACWSAPDARFWLLIAFATHVVMRVWSAFDFIPKALAFERLASKAMDQDAARRWTQRSRLRLPLDLVVGLSMLLAFATVIRSL
ncbi:hypothetical protein ACHMW7_05495 [Aminobacter sp. UC22_36]|uniref:hypothetical protein n=1 Tax=Aminobacter sp. UC22_36 TaxID=3374549 RepID=UPI003756C59B